LHVFRLQGLDEFGGDFYGSGYEGGDFDDQAAFAHPFDGEEATFEAVERSADYADCAAIHRFVDFAGLIIYL